MRVERRYADPPAALFAVLTDLGFLRARSERFGGRGEPTLAREPGAVVVTVPRQLPLAQVPGALRRYVGDGRLVQVERWARPTAADGAADQSADWTRVEADWRVDPGKAPLTLRGRHEITVVDGGCVHQVIVDLRVRVPLAGGAIAKQVGGHLADLVAREQAFAADWLRDHP
jgi:hypothetical protein